jgi:ubiquinone/menaquinone biosynthesis C-methylase UbiE
MDDKRFHGSPAFLRSPERRRLMEVEYVIDLALEGGASSALDVGCGSGLFAEAFRDRGLTAAGIDLSREMVGAARGLSPGISFLAGRAERLPFRDASFDLAFLGHLLHETEDPLRTLAEARRVARRRVAVLEWPFREEPMGPPLAHRLKSEDIRDLALSAGFGRIRMPEMKHMVLVLLEVFHSGSGDAR